MEFFLFFSQCKFYYYHLIIIFDQAQLEIFRIEVVHWIECEKLMGELEMNWREYNLGLEKLGGCEAVNKCYLSVFEDKISIK